MAAMGNRPHSGAGHSALSPKQGFGTSDSIGLSGRLQGVGGFPVNFSI